MFNRSSLAFSFYSKRRFSAKKNSHGTTGAREIIKG
jgi:hypothetical protein